QAGAVAAAHIQSSGRPRQPARRGLASAATLWSAAIKKLWIFIAQHRSPSGKIGMAGYGDQELPRTSIGSTSSGVRRLTGTKDKESIRASRSKDYENLLRDLKNLGTFFPSRRPT